MPAITWPQAFVLVVAMLGTFYLAHSNNPQLASVLSTSSALVMLYQRRPGDPTPGDQPPPPNPPAGP